MVKREDPEIFVTAEPVTVVPESSLEGSAPIAPNAFNDAYGVAMITVIAPSTLSAGYTFVAQVDGKDFLVTVPEGGVVAGQQFQVPYPGSTVTSLPSAWPSETHPVTLMPQPPLTTGLVTVKGRWTTCLWGCFGVFCNGLFWQSLFCNPILFGQLAQRMRLGCCGDPIHKPSNVCTVITISYLLYVCSYVVALGPFIWPFWLMYTWILVMNVRYAYRSHYQIKPACCNCCDGRMDDFCCAVFCSCCAGIQMARQTHEERRYPYHCCSPTGLDPTAPEVV